MALDFRQVQEQVQKIGEGAQKREQLRQARLALANQWLEQYNLEWEGLRRRVEQVVQTMDASLRCAVPPDPQVAEPEPLKTATPVPPLPVQGTIIAADGSQILPDRHAEVLYSLINVGAIQMALGLPEPPREHVTSQLIYQEDPDDSQGMISELLLSIIRDRHERSVLAELAQKAPPPVITFTDGPIELWSIKGSAEEAKAFQQNLKEYLQSLQQLYQQQVIVGGYVDKPGASHVVRLLEVASAEPEQLQDLRNFHPLRGVTDIDLFKKLLKPGERSAVFALQAQSAKQYQGPLALHFFYLNAGRENHPWLARVDVPAWVAGDLHRLELLHAALIDQCRMMGARHFPYLLQRAHETAVVSLQEKEQVTQMIALELRRRGVQVGEASAKQESKEMAPRTRYKL